MRRFSAHPPVCERARQWSSLRLDGELSELEDAALDSHLTSCADCRSFAAGSAIIAGDLRLAPLVALARPVAVPARARTTLRVVQAGAAAAVVALAVGLGAVLGLRGGTSARSAATPSKHAQAPSTIDDNALLREVRLALLKPSHTERPGLGLPV